MHFEAPHTRAKVYLVPTSAVREKAGSDLRYRYRPRRRNADPTRFKTHLHERQIK